jgi:energy-coupling factor transport system substrate-specific component
MRKARSLNNCATIKGAEMNEHKLKSKDLITIAIFTVLFVLVYFAVATLAVMAIFLYPFCVALAMTPCGIIWAYLRVKVPKRFAILLQSVLFALLFFLLGSGWFVALGALVGGVLAELLSRAGKHRSFQWNAAGYAALAASLNMGVYAIILFAPGYYYGFGVESGMDAGYMEFQVSAVTGPLLLLTTALTAAGAAAGMLFGRAMLKKHFEKAGII